MPAVTDIVLAVVVSLLVVEALGLLVGFVGYLSNRILDLENANLLWVGWCGFWMLCFLWPLALGCSVGVLFFVNGSRVLGVLLIAVGVIGLFAWLSWGLGEGDS